jgi:hypothetical protein
VQRMVIGLGVEASVVDTQVTLYTHSNGNSVPLMTFTSHADSAMVPGVGITGPAGAAAGGARVRDLWNIFSLNSKRHREHEPICVEEADKSLRVQRATHPGRECRRHRDPQ